GFLWSLLFLSRFLSSSPRQLRQNSFCLALGTPITFLTCGYYGLFSLFFLPLAFLFQLRRGHLNLKIVGQLLAIALAATALTGPFLWVQQQRLAVYQFTRSAQTIENNSAKLAYYRNFLDYNLPYRRILGLKSAQGQRLFPGLGLLVLAGLGLFGGQQKRIKLYLILAVALALLLSLGLRLNVGGVQPYQWARDYVPGFAQLRSPFRFAVLVQLHLALLAGFGLYNLGRWVGIDANNLAKIIAAERMRIAVRTPNLINTSAPKLVLTGVALLAIFEALALPLPLQAVPIQVEPTTWQAWLNEQNGPAHIVLLPFAQSSKVEDFEQTTRWMLANRYFTGDMLNGYSGFFPPDHGRVRDVMLNFSAAKSIPLLQQKGIAYVVVYHGLAKAPASAEIERYLPLVYRDEGENVAIYALRE
ncbi:MAG TPA: hypothetical protein VEC93_21535, partial [Anaerolineae bacterium]|nr:hypothetical protein [Anaerolineae bacterium]